MEQSDQGYAVMAKMMGMGMGALGKAFYKRYGKEALPIIVEALKQGNDAWCKVLQQVRPVKGMEDVGKVYDVMAPKMGIREHVVVELSDRVFHSTISNCPFGIEGTSKELCEAMMSGDKEAVNTLLGREVDMNIPKSVAAGDEKCEVIFSVK